MKRLMRLLLVTSFGLLSISGMVSAQGLVSWPEGQKRGVVHFADGDSMQYLFYTPAEAFVDTTVSLPLLVFLHGGGEGGTDIEKVKVHGPPKLVEQGHHFPFFILSPQNPYERGFWDEHKVMKVLEDVLSKTRLIDSSRIYLTGMSRGGYGAWRMMMQYPEMFAAVAPVCGAVAHPYAMWVPDIPIWVFHGEEDPIIPVEESIQMVDELKERGHTQIRLTTYPGVGHNSWENAYDEQSGLYQWFLQQRKKP